MRATIPAVQVRRRRRSRSRSRSRKRVYSGADAVNEEDPERDRATQV